MRVLVVAGGEPWPLDGGGRLHLYHVLTRLALRADVTLLLPRRTEYREHLPENMRVVSVERNDGARGTNVAVSPMLRRSRRCFSYSAAIEAWLRRNAVPEHFDVVMLNGPARGAYVEACRAPVVWNQQDELVLPTMRDAQFSDWKTWGSALKGMALFAAFERAVAKKADATIYVSKLDAAYARRWCGDTRIEVVQNGVDFDYFRPAAAAPIPRTVAFVGSLEFLPNIDAMRYFTHKIWPGVYAADSRRRFEIVGRRPVASVRELASAPGVKIIPDVPDVRPYLARASVVVVPVRKGGGLKNKVLEACAARRPVAAHPRAMVGLSARLGIDVVCASTPRQWSERLGRLLDSPEHAARIARNGYEWVSRAHDWGRTGDRFYEILASVARFKGADAASRATGDIPARGSCSAERLSPAEIGKDKTSAAGEALLKVYETVG